MIEHIIHQIWYQGELECPEKFKKGIESWKNNHPTWQYMFWDETKMRRLMKLDYPQYYKKWDRFNYMHQRIDFFKYILMDKYGGCYADIDTTSLKPIDPLLKYDIGGKEGSSGTIIVAEMTKSVLSSFDILGSVNNGIIISSRGHLFWKWYMYKIIKQCNKTWWTKFSEIENTTGPSFFSKCIMNYKGDGITILNYTAFEPCAGSDAYCVPSSESYVNHQHEQSWVHPGLQFLSGSYFYLKENWWILFGVGCVIFCTIFFLYK